MSAKLVNPSETSEQSLLTLKFYLWLKGFTLTDP